MNVRDFIVKKVPAILGLAAYAFGLIGSVVCLCVNKQFIFAVGILPTFVFGVPVVLDCIKELFGIE